MAGDPVAAGFAESLAKPSRNATGLSVVYTELVAKRMDLLHQLVPKARRIGHLTNSSNSQHVGANLCATGGIGALPRCASM